MSLAIPFRILALLSLVFLAAGCAEPEAQPDTVIQPATAQLQDLGAESIAPLIRESAADSRITLVNVWATWCAPCVKEFPMIVRLQRTYPESVRVIFISADFEEDRDRAVEFLAQQSVDWVTYFNTSSDERLIQALSTKWTGALPLTQVYDLNGRLDSEWWGEADYEDFENAYLSALGKELQPASISESL